MTSYSHENDSYSLYDCTFTEMEVPGYGTESLGSLSYGSYGYSGYECEAVYVGDNGKTNVFGCESTTNYRQY